MNLPVLEDDNIIKIPFGYKSSVVVVNAENPISEITIDQLATMFGDSSATPIYLVGGILVCLLSQPVLLKPMQLKKIMEFLQIYFVMGCSMRKII